VVFLILRHLRSALIVALVVPVAVLASFGAMAVFGIPSNIMSLAGIAIAIGVLADSALVMTENAYSRLQERGAPPRRACAGLSPFAKALQAGSIVSATSSVHHRLP
jgi:Cu/Ag efflux pump CusA